MALRGTATAMPRFAGHSEQKEERHGPGERDSGDVAARTPLARGDLVPEGGLLELGPDSELTVQATVSTREITLVGPALAEACPGGDEAVRLSYGKVTAFPGAGVRPGADVWIASPLGVVRFSDAQIEITVPDRDAARVAIAVITGQATFLAANGGVTAAPGGAGQDASRGHRLAAGEAIALAPGVTFAVQRPEGTIARWIGDLVAECIRRAAAARQAAQRVGLPRDGARGELGDLAFAHVRARQQARAACEAAWAGGALAPAAHAADRADLERADATWKGAP
jgi:hypothetical protein